MLSEILTVYVGLCLVIIFLGWHWLESKKELTDLRKKLNEAELINKIAKLNNRLRKKGIEINLFEKEIIRLKRWVRRTNQYNHGEEE